MSSHTIVKADLWKLGQVKAGDFIRYKAVSWEDAYSARMDTEKFVNEVVKCCAEGGFTDVLPLETVRPSGLKSEDRGSGVILQIEESGNQPLVSYRQVSMMLFLPAKRPSIAKQTSREATTISSLTMVMVHST